MKFAICANRTSNNSMYADKEWSLMEKKVREIAAEQTEQANADTASLDVAAAETTHIRSSRSAQLEASSASNTTVGIKNEKAV